ncbi:MAG: Fe-S cluster assembly scaffold protein NifU [Methanomicrobiales archaeon]|nr:Fe-S cluster assembly scaffold protein NifU [Methanomicrobiales archaeon]
MYTKTVMDHFQNPRNVGELPDADTVVEVGSPECGDTTRIFLKIDNNRIVDVKFQTLGCAAAIASSSMATEMIKGKTLEEAWKLTNHDVADALGGLPEKKMHCSMLAEGAIRQAINQYRTKQGLAPWTE